MTNTPTTLDGLIRRSVHERGDALALADAPNRADFFHGEPLRLTWIELDAAIDNLAASLADNGITTGNHVAIQLPNVVELPVTILACARLGVVAVPFPIQHRRHELRHGCKVANVDAMVTAARPDRPDQVAAAAEVLSEHRPGAPLLAFGPTDQSDTVAIELDTTNSSTPPPHNDQPDDTVTVCWTSGTTGDPKGVPRTNAMWLASCSFQVEQLRISADDRILCPFPVVNMAGIGGMLLPWAMAGAALHLHQPLDLPVFLQQLTAEAITYTVAPPPLLNMLLRNEAMLADVDLSNVRAISSGSAPLDPWMVEGWQDRGIEIVNVFGSNEGAALLSTKESVPDPAQRARYFPVPNRPGVETRLVSLETGDEITEPGVPGELRFGGPTVFSGYLQSTGEEFDEQGFYRTGDVFELAGDTDPPNLLRFVDRAKDIIIRGGMNVSAAEVETLVSSHPSIAECAAVAYPDPDLGERVGLFAVAAPDTEPATLEDILEHLRAHDIASYKLPERLEFVEALPRNPVGKVTKPALRDRWR